MDRTKRSIGQLMTGVCRMTCPKHGMCLSDCTSVCAPKTPEERQRRINAVFQPELDTDKPEPITDEKPRRRLLRRLFGEF